MALNHNPCKTTIGPPEPTIPCLEPACNRHFYNRTGRSNHIRSKHPQLTLDPQQQPNAPTSSNSIPRRQTSSSPSESSSTVSSNSRSRSREGGDDESIDNLDNNFNADIVFDGGYEGGPDGQRSSSSPTRTSSPASARSSNWAHEPHVPVIPRINRTYHPIINGLCFNHILTVIHIY